MRNTGCQLINETVGPLFMIMESTTCFSPNNYDSENSLIKFDHIMADRGYKPLEVVFNCLVIGDSSLLGDVTHILLINTLSLHLSLDKIPYITDLALENLDDIRDPVPKDLEVSLSVGHALRDR